MRPLQSPNLDFVRMCRTDTCACSRCAYVSGGACMSAGLCAYTLHAFPTEYTVYLCDYLLTSSECQTATVSNWSPPPHFSCVRKLQRILDPISCSCGRHRWIGKQDKQAHENNLRGVSIHFTEGKLCWQTTRHSTGIMAKLALTRNLRWGFTPPCQY